MDDSIFAEIEIEEKQGDGSSASLRGSRGTVPLLFAVAPPQPIQPRIIDPIREKFYEMRKLASQRPFARSDSELFYRQARFMEDFTDDYEGDAKFNMYYPYYQNMGYDYLRTYFTWRTKVRNGDIQPTSLSYIFLYIYEILSGIGTTDPADGLDKLLAIWNTPFIKAGVEKYLPKWLKDYFIFYEIKQRDGSSASDTPLVIASARSNPVSSCHSELAKNLAPVCSFSEFIEKHNMQKYYSLSLLFDDSVDNKLELWNSISGYNITNSRFYKDGNEQALSECFTAVLNAIQDFCIKRNTRFEDLLVYSVSRRSPWQPFKQALFGSRAKQNDREIIISAFEKYYCKNGQWTANLPIYYSSQKDFVGYIIKKTEACLRQETKYKYKLVAEMRSGSKPFRELQRPAAKRAELDKVIEKAVSDFYINQNRIAVKVDHTNLARIREEALETQEQLIVTEEHDKNLDRHCGLDPQSPVILSEAKNLMPTIISEQSQPEEPLTLSFADGWKALKNALTDVERQALALALQENADIKAFADENNIMLEVLADSINEKAADSIGDNLLEIDEDMILYDEYRENVASII